MKYARKVSKWFVGFSVIAIVLYGGFLLARVSTVAFVVLSILVASMIMTWVADQ